MSDFLTRLRALDAAASGAPWSILGGHEDYAVYVDGAKNVGYDGELARPDAALIVALRNAAPRIAALVEAAGALLARNTVAVIDPAKCGDPSAWIAVSVKNFDALRAALAALDKEGA